jgi:hypothetical protein
LRLYDQGQLDLDGMVTQTYKLEDINQGYADMLAGKNIRGVLQSTSRSFRPGADHVGLSLPDGSDRDTACLT